MSCPECRQKQRFINRLLAVVRPLARFWNGDHPVSAAGKYLSYDLFRTADRLMREIADKAAPGNNPREYRDSAKVADGR